MSSDQKKTVTRNFHGHEYALTVSVASDILAIECKENYRGGGVWTSKFTNRFIEEITQRTGNFKTFPVFTKMLLLALNGDSESVTLDLLNADDLERMRNAQQRPRTQQSTITSTDKRYLILTYQVEFDKVHYPLALTQLHSAAFAPESHPVVPSACACGAAMLHADLQRQLVDSLAREAANRGEFQRLVEGFQAERDRMRNPGDELAGLREANRFFEAELKAIKEGRLRTAARHRKELEDLNLELSSVKHSERQLKIKLKQLESDLAAVSVRSSARRPSASPMHPVPISRTQSPRKPAPSRAYSRTPSPSRYREEQPKRYEPMSPQRQSPVRTRLPSSRPSTGTDRSMVSDVMRSPEMRSRVRIAEAPGVDIKDIDARLHALQNFLRQTKLSGGI